MAAYQNV